ncbi:hypothetical protein SYNPS1DRAFT_18034, partial [Syncephalis pseudoplumigaleata]
MRCLALRLALAAHVVAIITIIITIVFAGYVDARCNEILVRREVRDLTRTQWDRFVRAVNKIMTDSTPSTYDKLTSMHIKHAYEVHHSPMFLPWHRKYIKLFENELRKHDKSIAIPYWDWSVDSQHPHLSPVLSPLYYGGNGRGRHHCVPDTPFAKYRPRYVVGNDYPCISREYNDGNKLSPFSSTEDLARITASSESMVWFYPRLEARPHAAVHLNLGNQFSGPSATNDPIFFAHHAFIDHLWALWQRRRPEHANDMGVLSMDAKLPAFDVPVSTVVHTEADGLCYRY